MKIAYRVILSAPGFYKEYTLPEDQTSVTLGTAEGCGLSVPHSSCAAVFSAELKMNGTDCGAVCSEGVCFPGGKQTAAFHVQDALTVLLPETETPLLTVTAAFAFKKKPPRFDLGVELPQGVPVSVGGAADCRIRLTDPVFGSDAITLRRDGTSYYLWIGKARYGVYVNGKRQDGSCDLPNYTFISLDGFELYIRNGYLYVEAASGVSCPEGWGTVDGSYSRSHLDYPRFNKSTRLLAAPSAEKIEILDPSPRPEQKKTDILLQLLPAVAMLALVILLRGVMGGGGSFVIFSACSMGLGIVTSVISIFTGKRDAKRADEARTARYQEYVKRKREEIEEARAEEKRQLENVYRNLERDIQAVKDFSPELFDRSAEDEDFLQVYLGTGDRPARRAIAYRRRETIELGDELMQIPEQLCREYKYVRGAPVWCDLRTADVVGVVGESQRLYGMMKNFTLDLCTRQFYRDVKLFYVINTDFSNYILWLRWLPHVRNDELHVRNIVCSDESKTTLFEYLYSILASREQTGVTSPHIVVLILSDVNVKNHPLSKYLDKCAALGVTFVFFDNYADLLPDCCDELVTLSDSDLTGTLIRRNDSGNGLKFTYTLPDDETARQAALRLAPIYCEEVSLEGNLPAGYSFFECYDIWSAADLDLQRRWDSADVSGSLAAPIGINARREPVYLDIHERAHGPHGLVAGTTGSGKSELLQSYILSMSLCYPPHEVAFLIIDFKGGGMANQLRELPHLAGTITNIDGREIGRSLKSIKAELKKRQYLFAQNGVNKIDDYIRLYNSGAVDQPLPHLIIVVDEFAELKADQPDFMKELISAARIGRSLGIHLILATQKPAGQVNDQIWSNSRFRMCLKVQTREDSNEMLKSPLAAEIREPGRAYLQVGNNEVFELFQSAYSGGAADYEAASAQEEFRLAEVSLWGKRRIVFEQKNNLRSQGGKTQLEAVIGVISDYCARRGIARLPGICLPPLPERLPFPAAARDDMSGGASVELGLYDDPDNQVQGKVVLNLSAGNLFLVGSSQSGKTNALQTILRGLTDRYRSDQVNLYILDFASMILKNFDGLAHVGGVAVSQEDEKVRNLIKMLLSELTARKERLAESGVTSFAAYLEAGKTDMAQIILMIDNFTAFRELYPDECDLLLTICREGVAAGITLVVANAQTSGFGYKYMSNFAYRIGFFCNDPGEYANLFDRARLAPQNIPGRGVVKLGGDVLEFQCYLSFEGEREIDRANAMRKYAESVNQANRASRARRIPVVPEVVTRSGVRAEQPELFRTAYRIPFGVSYTTMEVESLNLLQLGALGISGREGGGRTNFLMNLIHTLQEDVFLHSADVYILDSPNKRLAAAEECGCVRRYSTDPAEAEGMVSGIFEELTRRKNLVREQGASIAQVVDPLPLQLLILSGKDALSAVCDRAAVSDKLMSVIRELHEYRACVLITGIENSAVPFSAPAVLKYLKETRAMLIFEDAANIRFLEISMREQKEFSKEIRPGDAYAYLGGKLCRIRTMLDK